MTQYKPYAQYKDSGVEWTSLRLDRIFSVVKERVSTSSHQLLTPSTVYGVIPQDQLPSRPQQALRDDYQVAPAKPNDFVISMSSHAHGIEWCGHYGGISPDYTTLRLKVDSNFAGYLKYALKSTFMISQLGQFKSGVRMGLRLQWNDVRVCTILLPSMPSRSEEHTSELQSRGHLVCRLLLEKK